MGTIETGARQADAAASGTFQLGGDLEVNRLGFGAMRITGKGIWGEPSDPDHCRAVLRRAMELGVNFIDTADSYGPEVSERLIAETLYPYADGVVIATKGGPVYERLQLATRSPCNSSEISRTARATHLNEMVFSGLLVTSGL